MKNKILMILLLLGIIFSTNSITRTYQHIEKRTNSIATVISTQDSKCTYSYNYNGITYTNNIKLNKNINVKDKIEIKINPSAPSFSTTKKEAELSFLEIIIILMTLIVMIIPFTKTKFYTLRKEKFLRWMKLKLPE